MARSRLLRHQIFDIWKNGYNKEAHSVLAFVIAKTTYFVGGLTAWVFLAIFKRGFLRETVRTWRASRKGNQA